MNIQKLNIADIEIGPRLRAVDQERAELMAASFREIGQQTPILVRKPDGGGNYRLMAGAHRIRAAELAGLKHVLATVQEVSNTEAELIEVDENLLRSDLTVMDRDAFLAKRKRLYLALHPETAHGGDPKSKKEKGQVGKFANLDVERFTADAAKRLGVSEAVIQKAVTRANAISKEVREKLTGTRFADNASELKALASLPTADAQMRAIELALAEGEGGAPTLRAAVDQVAGRVKEEVSSTQRAFDAFQRTWQKDKKFQKRVRAYIAALDASSSKAAAA